MATTNSSTTIPTDSTITDLRKVVNNQRLAHHDRQHAAQLLVAHKMDVASHIIPPPSDPEVLALSQPWSRDSEHDAYIADLGRPFGSDGIPVAEAQAIVSVRWVQRALLAAVVDASLPELERLESTRALLDGLSPEHPLRYNRVTADALLKTVRPDAPPAPQTMNQAFR